MSIRIFVIYVLISSFCGCIQQPQQDIFLGQGIMSGEATSSSIILQTRLTQSDTLLDGDLPGSLGYVRFEISVDPTFNQFSATAALPTSPDQDFIIKKKIGQLEAGTQYYYRALYGRDSTHMNNSLIGSFKTLSGARYDDSTSLVIVTGMNYYYFHYGRYDQSTAYSGMDKNFGYPALESIKNKNPDYFIGTGDNVYFDHPHKTRFDQAKNQGKNPHPGGYLGRAVVNDEGMRKKYHEQFSQPRFRNLFRDVSTYWLKDDHDYRYNDSDPFMDFAISHQQGIRMFREQLPVVELFDPSAVTYRTHQLNKDLQIWLLEGRDYRSSNDMEDGPDKTIWGNAQKDWLQETLLASNATFKILISPTPLIGPDDAYKKDNHTNPEGFLYEATEFYKWLQSNEFLSKNLYFICGDRHWQYHAQHPTGFEEFSTGALVDNNSRAGRNSGDPNSTDPEGLIKQFYVQGTPAQASGGFLQLSVISNNSAPKAIFSFFDEHGILLYQHVKDAN